MTPKAFRPGKGWRMLALWIVLHGWGAIWARPSFGQDAPRVDSWTNAVLLIERWRTNSAPEVATAAESGDPAAQLVFAWNELEAAKTENRTAFREADAALRGLRLNLNEMSSLSDQAKKMSLEELERNAAGNEPKAIWMLNARKTEFAEIARSIPLGDIEKRAASGEGFAQWLLGSRRRDLAQGRGLEAFKWMERAARQGLPEAQKETGLRLIRDFLWPVVPMDVQAGVAWLEKAAEGGNLAAHERLAKIYRTGRIVPKDTEAALRHLRPLVVQGSPWACYALAIHHAQGEGEPRGPEEEPLLLLRRAAEGGINSARWELGDRYLHGFGVGADPIEAAEWYCRARAGHSDPNDDTHTSDSWRIEYHFTSVKAELPTLAELQSGPPPFPRLLGLVVLALDHRDPAAMAVLGRLYLASKALPHAPVKAVGWLRLAVDAGHSPTRNPLQEIEAALSPAERAQADNWVSEITRELARE